MNKLQAPNFMQFFPPSNQNGITFICKIAPHLPSERLLKIVLLLLFWGFCLFICFVWGWVVLLVFFLHQVQSL